MHRLAAILLAAVLGGCACTQVGCANSVEFQIAADLVRGEHYDVEACLDDLCRSGTLMIKENPGWVVAATDDGLGIDTDAERVFLSLVDGDYSGEHELRVFVRHESGELLAEHAGTYEFAKTEPNGAWCGPTCWDAVIEAPVP